MNKKKFPLIKIIKIISSTLLIIFLIGLPYMLGFWGYNFLAGVFTFLPKLSFWKFFLVVIAIELIRNLFSKSKKES